MKNEKFFKASGVLMVIGGAMGLIVSIAAMLGLAKLFSATGDTMQNSAQFAGAFLVMVSSAVAMVAGSVGYKHSENHEKAGVCIVWGLIVAAMSIGGTVLTAAGGGVFSVLNLVLGIVLPALYIIGAAMNRHSEPVHEDHHMPMAA